MSADPTGDVPPAGDPPADRETALLRRIEALEGRLHDSEETLGAIRRGEIDALVVSGRSEEHQVYTLESADRPYRVLIEHIREGALTLSDDGTILYCNRRLAELLGTAQERVIGHSLRHHVLPGEEAEFDRLLDEARTAGSRGEVTLRTADGAEVPIYMSVNPLEGDDGSTLLCGVLTDLTEQKLRFRELAEANHRLKQEIAERERIEEALRQSQKMEAIGQLTGGLAHDVNNMLQGIGGAFQMIEKRIGDGRLADVPRLLRAGREGVDRAAGLTNGLLAFARRGRLDAKAVIIDDVVRGMSDLVRRTVGPAIEVQLRTHDGDWTVCLDRSGLESALLNLAINARDAMPDGGRLVFSTREVRLSQAELGTDADGASPGEFVLVTVSDTGTGMPPSVVARVFEPFFTTKPIGQGTGLGLSQLYGFVRQSGGFVRIESAPGEGTTVRLHLPRAAAAAAGGDEPGIPERGIPDPGGGTVLLVEDEPAIRALAAEVLREQGYAVLEAEDGPSGLAALAGAARVDLLVTDVGLPGLNGRQLADAARERRPTLSVLFITGYAGTALDGDLPPGMAAITKPFSLDALTAKVAAMLAPGEPPAG